jgi:SAM-dependent MidA family methyltransferase
MLMRWLTVGVVQVAWLTPVELFQPHYGNAIAKYVLETFKHALHTKTDLHIYEIGGGTGTLAKNVLVCHIQHIAPSPKHLNPTAST